MAYPGVRFSGGSPTFQVRRSKATAFGGGNLLQYSEKVNKDELLRSCSEKIIGYNVTEMELCNAMANYYKHHDEWTKRSDYGSHKGTASVLEAVEINKEGTFPFDRAFSLLWPGNGIYNLKPFVSMISEWRSKVIKIYVVSKK